MNFQQLRSVREAVRCGFNLTEVALALHTSQPGVSRQVRELEEELGVELFVRSGKRLLGLTTAGKTLLPMVERVLQETDNLRRAGQDLQGHEEGRLSIAATHSQARYALPHVVKDFRQRYPKVTLPCYRWTHSIVLPKAHPLLALSRPVTLHDLAAWPIITYEVGYTGRSHIDQAFAAQGLQPDVVLTAMDADVIKTYVELEMGVGIVASIALDDERDRHLGVLDAGHLFPVNLTRLGIARSHWLPGFAYGFIEAFVPTLTQEVVQQALAHA